MGRPTRKAARMSEWVLHCEVKQRHIRRSQPTRDAALKDACSQLLQGYSVNRIVGPNETITAERIKSWCASRGFPQEPMAPTRFTSGALITRNNFDALDGGFPGPRPRGRTSGRHTRAGFSFWRKRCAAPSKPGAALGLFSYPLSLLRTA